MSFCTLVVEGTTVRVHGFGFFEPVDRIHMAWAGQMLMPPGAFSDLQEPAYVFLETPTELIPFEIKSDVSRELDYTFHLECYIRKEQLGQLVTVRVQNWRRYLSLPITDMVAKPPSSCSGPYRVAVWVPPQMPPAVAAKLVVWHTKYHIAIGFSCELVYLYHNQLEAALQNAAIIKLVQQAHLWLVLIEDFFPGYTLQSQEFGSGIASNLINGTERGTAVIYVDQTAVNAHSCLASTGQDTWLLSVDLDEFMAMSHTSELKSTISKCFGGKSAEIVRVPVTCPSCVSKTDVTEDVVELSVWIEESGRHPLAYYTRLSRLLKSLLQKLKLPS